MKSIVPSLALLVTAFGAADAVAALEPSRGENPAVLALLDAAGQDLTAGRPDQASVMLERALRIEPGNPAVWHALGLARLAQGRHTQAEAMAAKSKNLAPHDWVLRARNARLTAAAVQASGRTVAPSDERPLFASRNSADVELEPASTYVDTPQRREAPHGVKQRFRGPAPGVVVVRSPDRRGSDDRFAEQVRRQRAARQGRIESRGLEI